VIPKQYPDVFWIGDKLFFFSIGGNIFLFPNSGDIETGEKLFSYSPIRR
jgi:hypothetical protein